MHALAPHFRGQVFEGRGYTTRLTSATPGIGTCTPPAAPHHPRAHCTASPHRLRVRAAYLPSRPGAGGRGDLQAHGARARHVLATVRAVRVPLPQGAAFSAPHLASSSRPAVARTGQRHAAPGHPVLSRATLAPPPLYVTAVMPHGRTGESTRSSFLARRTRNGSHPRAGRSGFSTSLHGGSGPLTALRIATVLCPHRPWPSACCGPGDAFTVLAPLLPVAMHAPTR